MPSYEGGGYLSNVLGQGYVDPSDKSNKDLTQMKDFFYQANYTGNSTLWMQGNIDRRFKVGDQQLYQQFYGSNSTQYSRFFINLIRRHINMTCGFQRRNRKSTITQPINDNDDPLSDDYNAVVRWCEDRDGFQEYLSQAFEESCSVGESLLHLYPDYTLDPISGDLFTDSVAMPNYLIDQYYAKQDLSDCNGIWRRRWTSKEVAKQMLPGYAKEIDKMRTGGMRDGRFPVQAELQNVAYNNLFTYDEFYYRTTRPGHLILDPHTGESVEWEEDEQDEDNEEMMRKVMYEQPWLIKKPVQIPTTKLVISLGGKTVYHGKNLLAIDPYPFVPSQCYYERDVTSYAWRKMGMIRNMRDPQFLYNMRKVIELSILQSQVTSGWIYPVDALVDVKSLRQTGEGYHIGLKAGHLPNEIQRIEAAAIPQSLMELSASLAEDITKVCGVNEELLGSATDDKSGILSMLRQGAGLTTLQTIFDKLDYTQRLYGKIRLQAIRKNFSKGKIRNILGHEADPRFWTSHSQKYSIAVEEGNYSTSQRQMELQQLLHFKELGMAIPDKSIMRAAFITNKKLVMQEMEEANQQQMQQQQAQSQAQEKMDQSKIMEAFSRSKSNLAKEMDLMASAQERQAKIHQLEASAEHEMQKADLDMVKTMIELEDMDLQQIRNNLELAQIIKATNKASSEVTPQEALTG